MLFAEGSKVRFIHTGEEGVITEIVDDQHVMVLIDDDFEIPTHIENIVTLRNKKGKNNFEPHALTKKEVAQVVSKPLKEKNNEGVLVAFEPIFESDASVSHYNIYLVNDTSYRLVYDFELTFRDADYPKKSDLIDSYTASKIGECPQSELSENPKLSFQLTPISTAGAGKPIDKVLKIKAKQFFNKQRRLSFTMTHCHVYTLLEKFKEEEKEDLKAYAKKHYNDKAEQAFYEHVHVHTMHKIKHKAEFSEEIDLHVEKITVDHPTLSPAEKLDLQLRVFEEYLSQAVSLGMPKVYIIHGLGKGRLKKEIHKRLELNPYVKIYQNDHHPKYGFGATEVYLD